MTYCTFEISYHALATVSPTTDALQYSQAEHRGDQHTCLPPLDIHITKFSPTQARNLTCHFLGHI